MLYTCMPPYTCGGQRTSSSKPPLSTSFERGCLRFALFPVCYTKPAGQRAPGRAPASLPLTMHGLYMLTLLQPALCGFWRLELRSSDLSGKHLYSPQPGKFNPSSCFLPVYLGCPSGSSGCLQRIPLTQFIEKLLVRSLREFSIPPFKRQKRRH